MQREIKEEKKLHLKSGNPSFKTGSSTAVLIFSGWFPFPLILHFRCIFMTSHMTLPYNLIVDNIISFHIILFS